MSDFLNYIERNYGCVAEYQRCMAEEDNERWFENNAEKWEVNKEKLTQAGDRAMYFCEDCMGCKHYEDVGPTFYDGHGQDDVTHGICHHKEKPFTDVEDPFCKGYEKGVYADEQTNAM